VPTALRSGVVLALVAGGLLVVVATLAGDWPAAAGALAAADPAPLAASLPIHLLHTVLMAVVWRDVLAVAGARLGLVPSYRLMYRAALAKYLPGRIWPLAGMAALAAEVGVSARLATLASIGTVVLVAVTGAAVGALAVVMQRAGLAFGATAAGTLIGAAAIALLGAVVAGERGRLAGRAIAVALASWLLVALASWLVLAALQRSADEHFAPLLVSVTLAWAAGLVAPVPAGIGVREAVQTLALAEAVPPGVAAALALLYRLVGVLVDLIAAAIAWSLRAPPGGLPADAPLHPQ
jgi:uncharacterized membrane protein YbhN (UPF0104 family)